MPEPFKNFFNPKMVALMASHLRRVWSDFDEAAFVKMATRGFVDLELKERSEQIKQALAAQLPKKFSDAAAVLIDSLHPDDDIDLSGTSMDEQGIRGWAILPMTQYVGERGIDDFDLGMTVQKELTKRFSSEFGIRYFILADKKRALATLSKWTGDKNYHVRRLVSESTRPRLPWAMQLPAFIKDPKPLLPILTKLKDDDQEYVRRSVANNLNDIAKDHPDIVAEIAGEWLKNVSPEREKLVRHACRTLIKQGHKPTLSALGYKKPKVSLPELEILTPIVIFGDALKFKIGLQSKSTSKQNLILDYIIHHRKANGKTTPKVFKWKTLNLKPKEFQMVERKHALKPITTRKYYGGTHRLEIIANGESLGLSEFELIMPDS